MKVLKDTVIERNEIKQIRLVEFGILSEDEIIAQSVAEITKNRLFSAKQRTQWMEHCMIIGWDHWTRMIFVLRAI